MRRDELKQPLHKRSLTQRLWQQRPSALVTAYAALLITYACTGAWLVQQKLPYAGEPIVTAQVPALETVQTAKTPVIVQDTNSQDVADVEPASTDQVDAPMPDVPKQKNHQA